MVEPLGVAVDRSAPLLVAGVEHLRDRPAQCPIPAEPVPEVVEPSLVELAPAPPLELTAPELVAEVVDPVAPPVWVVDPELL